MEDRSVFFGRQKEANELAAYTLAHRVVLVYSESGAGKTSLVNAGLIPALESEFHFQVLPPARVRMTETGTAVTDNIYLLQAMLSIDPDLSVQAAHSLSMLQFLRRLDRPSTAQGQPAPRLLVIDQFEEILTVYNSDAHTQQIRFFEELDAALEGDHLLRLILLVREDYAPRLEPFEPLLRKGQWMRFRLPSLDRDGALEAIQRPVKGTDHSFADGVPELIVERLLETKALSPSGRGEPIRVRGRVVEPVQLQVVCKALWDHKQGSGDITREDFQDFGDVGRALSAYYDSVVSRVCSEGHVSEEYLRRWFGKRLITPIGTRGSVLRQEKTTDDALPVPNSVIDELDGTHIIREETRAGGRWYELAHDAFVDPIVESNAIWERKRQELEQDLQRNALLVATQRPVGASVTVDWRKGISTRAMELESLAQWLAHASTDNQATAALRVELIKAVATHLEAAREAAGRRSGQRFLRRRADRSLIETATSNLDAAEAVLLQAAPPGYILGQMPALLNQVQRYLLPEDPQRQEFERIVEELGIHDPTEVVVPGRGKTFNAKLAIIDAERNMIVMNARAAGAARLRQQLYLPSPTLELLVDPEPPLDESMFVLSYMGLRKTVGIIGLALPIALLVGKPLVDGGGMLGSISAYYHTGMRNYFVGTLCALAVFLFSYRYAPLDNFLSTLASLFALGLVFFPTTPRGAGTTWTGRLHLTCAALFLLTLAYFAYFVFTRPPLPEEKLEPAKRMRNKIYRTCGVTIVVSLLLCPLLDLVLSDAVRDEIRPLFWLESIAVWAFSISWLIKGGLLLQD